MRPYLTIEVDDVDVVHADAVARGFDVVHPLTDEPWGVRRFLVVEPGGLVLNILGQTPLGDPERACAGRCRTAIGVLEVGLLRKVG